MHLMLGHLANKSNINGSKRRHRLQYNKNGGLQHPVSSMDRSSGQKKITKENKGAKLICTTDKICVLDFYSAFHLITAE